MPHEATLALYQVHAVTEGTDAQAEVSVRLEDEAEAARSPRARADPDTLVASRQSLSRRAQQAVRQTRPATRTTKCVRQPILNGGPAAVSLVAAGMGIASELRGIRPSHSLGRADAATPRMWKARDAA